MISVLMAAYNAAPYIRDAVDSALAQQGVRIEVIVADDGSTDDTLAVLARYGSRITTIAAPHRNASAARNTAWQASRGEYIVILDADDRLMPDAFTRKLELLEREPGVGVAYGDAMAIDERGSQIEPIPCPRRLTVSDNPLATLIGGNIFPVHAALTRRSAIERLPYLYHEEIDLVGDWDLWLRLAGVTRFAYAGDMSVEYRRHGTMSTRTIASDKGMRQTLNTLHRAFEVPGADALPPTVRDAALRRMLLLAVRLRSATDVRRVRSLMQRSASPPLAVLGMLAAAPGAASAAGTLINASLRYGRRLVGGTG